MLGDNSVLLRRIWTKLEGDSSYKPPGASYTAQGRQKQPDIMKKRCFANKTYKSIFLDLDFGFQTFRADSREEVAQALILVDLILVNCLSFFNFNRNGFLRC